MFVNSLNTYQWFRGTVSLLWFWAYFLNVVSFESFHQAIHHHDHSELHTQEAEEDACHRAIYHGETSHDCEHKSHITETITDCDLCKVLTTRSSDFVVSSQFKLDFFEVSTNDFIFGSEAIAEPFFHHTFLRGPPIA